MTGLTGLGFVTGFVSTTSLYNGPIPQNIVTEALQNSQLGGTADHGSVVSKVNQIKIFGATFTEAEKRDTLKKLNSNAFDAAKVQQEWSRQMGEVVASAAENSAKGAGSRFGQAFSDTLQRA